MKHNIGIVGRKAGMTRVFTADGRSVPVTLIEATPNRITQVKSDDVDGYAAVQIAVGTKRSSLVTKPLAGHYAKAKVEAGRALVEFPLTAEDACQHPAGGENPVGDDFQDGLKGDV